MFALPGHEDTIRSLSFATFTGAPIELKNHVARDLKPGDLMLASSSLDGYIRTWRINKLQNGFNRNKNDPNDDLMDDSLLESLEQANL